MYNGFIKLLLAFILCSCVQQESLNSKNVNVEPAADSATIDIDSLYARLSKEKRINYKEIPGQFNYIKSDEKSGRYLAKFIGRNMGKEINYISYGNNKNDTIIWGNHAIDIKSKLDPTSINIYEFEVEARGYIVFIGKGQSASGSGGQITFFVLLELDNKRNLLITREFESRFGSVNSLLDLNQDGTLDYIKIINSKKEDEYLLTVHTVNSNQNIGKGMMLLKYVLNDKFSILENTLVDL
ncbi:MAG: hypothetical protein QM763_01015 [Agriterribacter sp.]